VEIFALENNFQLADGNAIPALGFGTFGIFDRLHQENIIADAIACGYRHFDTASLYGSEISVGLGIKSSGIAREEFFLTTKVWKDDMESSRIRSSLESSLKKLQTDYVDLLLIHWPRCNSADAQWIEHLNEAFETFILLKKEGKVKSIGVSNFLVHHFEALKTAERPVVNQIEYHPGYMQQEVVDYCKKENIVVEAWSPLGRAALLTDKTVLKIAAKHKVSAAQVLLKFCLENGVLPIAKSTDIKRMQQNASLMHFMLDANDLQELSDIKQNTGWSQEHPDFAIPSARVGDF